MSTAQTAAHVVARPWLKQCDARLKLAWLIAVSLIALLVDSLPALATLSVVAALPSLGLHLSSRALLVVVWLIVLTVWSTMLSQGMFYQGTPRTALVEWGVFCVYREGLQYGLVQSLRFVASVLAGLTVVVSTGPERLLAALVWLRVPSAIAFVTVSALRSLPTLIDQWATIRRARWLRRGARSGIIQALLGELTVITPLVALALRRASSLAVSVTARGFRPDRERTFYPPLKLTTLECATGVTLALICTVIGSLKTLQWLEQAGTLEHDAITLLADWCSRWL